MPVQGWCKGGARVVQGVRRSRQAQGRRPLLSPPCARLGQTQAAAAQPPCLQYSQWSALSVLDRVDWTLVRCMLQAVACHVVSCSLFVVRCSLFVVRCKAADAPCLKNFARSRLSTSARSEMVTSTAAAVTGSKRTCSAAVSIRELQPVEPPTLPTTLWSNTAERSQHNR